MASVNGSEVAVNPYLDMVYRLPVQQWEKPVPVGVVSKNYRLVDHHQLLRTVEEVLADCGIALADGDVRGEWTVHGERARFSLLLPADPRFTIRLTDGDEMRFRIELFNSVDGSCRLMVVAGWLRFVCSNGLIIGTKLVQLRQQHRQQLEIEELGRLLRQGLEEAESDQRTVAIWQRAEVEDAELEEWVDNDVQEKWGLKAAARVLAICRTGRDAEVKGDLRGRPASALQVELGDAVPGMRAPEKTAFGVSQALTWLAGQRQDLQEDFEWRSEVPVLLRLLLSRCGGQGVLISHRV